MKMTDTPKPLRILICIRNLCIGAGGMERTAANLANHMQAAGHSVGVLCRFSEGTAPLYPLDKAVTRLDHTDTDHLSALANSFGADVVVAFYSHVNESDEVVALCQTGVPVILHEGSNPVRVINTNWAVVKKLTPEQANLERLALMSMCSQIRFTLPQYRDSLPDTLRADSVSFPNAFAPAAREDLALRSETGRKIFINIGGLKQVKNVIAAVKAFALIADEVPDWDFHIFSSGGKNNPVRPGLESFIDEAGLGKRVKIFPPTPMIGSEYGRSHVHVIASKEEGLPNCIAEASCHGLPSIGFACCAGTNSMIVPEHNGLLVDCGEDEIVNFAAAMRRIAKDSRARKRWGKTALKESVVYDPATIFAEWEKVIEKAAQDTETPRQRLERRFGEDNAWRRLRAVQRASLAATPWPVEQMPAFDDQPPLVSIVIPLFNKEPFIAETLETVAACTHPNIQVIVVNDCSTDASATIAGGICKQHGWELIERSENGGLSAARNTGLEAAQGDYVHFWDADDLYEPNGVGAVVRVMYESGSDIGTGIATRDGKVLDHYESSVRDVTGMNYAQLPESFITASTCFKVYRRDFLMDNNLRFEPGLFMQDSAFNMLAFPLAERIAMTSVVLGDYRQVEDSGARQFHPARFTSALRIADLTRDFYADMGLHALDVHRQEHVVGTVLTQFVRRARRDHALIDEQMRPEELDFDFLEKLQARLPALSEGLLLTTTPSPRVRTAYYAIREGYLNWVPEVLCGVRPHGIDAGYLAIIPAEIPVVKDLLGKLRPA